MLNSDAKTKGATTAQKTKQSVKNDDNEDDEDVDGVACPRLLRDLLLTPQLLELFGEDVVSLFFAVCYGPVCPSPFLLSHYFFLL